VPVAHALDTLGIVAQHVGVSALLLSPAVVARRIHCLVLRLLIFPALGTVASCSAAAPPMSMFTAF
jgi:hypothetical protein